MSHTPVLLQSVLHYISVRPGCRYLDATLGGGGHAQAIIQAGGVVLGMDQDPQALSACPELENLTKYRSNFIHLQSVVEHFRWQPVCGVLFDLGMSSMQLDSDRGFSYASSSKLDMRMDPDLSTTAADLLNQLPSEAVKTILTNFGELRNVGSIVNKLAQHRPYSTTAQIAAVIPHPVLRQVFQALRIAVNDELGAIRSALPQALAVTGQGGRILVISFHSLEDRLVKHSFLDWQKQGFGQVITPSPIVPDAVEVAANPKSHSAKLRVFEKK
jgi:16S rRNA (cytosine1402-N4)-methyltransferase